MSEPFLLVVVVIIIESIPSRPPSACLHVSPFMRRVVLFNAAHCLAFIINAVITARTRARCGCGKQDSGLADREETHTINADGRRPRPVYSPLVLCGGSLIGTCLGPGPEAEE